jgi:hypothetical protein
MTSQQVPGSTTTVLDPAEKAMVQRTIQQADALAGLTPWERHRIEWRVRRHRGELVLQIAQQELQTIFAEAVITLEGKVDRARERRALEHFKEQLRILIQAGHYRDEKMNETTRLSEDSREIIQGAIDRVTGSLIFGMERRGQGLT